MMDYGPVTRSRGNMAQHPKYQVEKTSVGMQYVIPGAEQISTGDFLTRKMAEPIRPRTRQRGLAGTALFGIQR